MTKTERHSSPLDRKLQIELLEKMAAVYPAYLNVGKIPQNNGQHVRAVIANIYYLMEHGLCIAQEFDEIGSDVHLGPPKITAKGLDFLADDGGLDAILSVVTVRFDADTLKSLLANKIDETDASEEEKTFFKKQLEALPDAALKAGTSELVKLGLVSVPNIFHWLQTLAPHV
ncbi:hypothetical protein [Acetobacter persici]|uniref:DUF2513 domain-containing protein n=1 Tax=Acetobacter persici TaxID=1076596 RepID=A0A6V8IGJ6_9PROT|nr:hypothetical protein [Acetobacter persici]OUI92693.1 hypothetical protein HK19_00900 [Acetobacter persici]GFE94405.1 hypothetical protein DmAi_24640 [Acetobacter persici]